MIATPFVSAPVLATMSAPSSILIAENDDVSPHDVDLRPRKRKAVDVGGGVLPVVHSLEDEIVAWETATIFIGEDDGAASECLS